jgi:predicted transcriptional regulator
MMTIRNEAIGYINELPEERLESAITYLRNLCEKKHPLEVSSAEELHAKIEEGLEDVRQGRTRPFKEAMADIRKRIAER